MTLDEAINHVSDGFTGAARSLPPGAFEQFLVACDSILSPWYGREETIKNLKRAFCTLAASVAAKSLKEKGVLNHADRRLDDLLAEVGKLEGQVVTVETAKLLLKWLQDADNKVVDLSEKLASAATRERDAVAREREACAILCEQWPTDCNCGAVDIGVGILHEPGCGMPNVSEIAATIRQRGAA